MGRSGPELSAPPQRCTHTHTHKGGLRAPPAFLQCEKLRVQTRRKHTESCLLRRQVRTPVQLHPCQRGLLSGTSGRRSPGVGVGGAKENKITANLSDHSASQTRGLQSPALGKGEQAGEAARLPQATLCLVTSEAATKTPTREQCPRPRCRSLPGRRRTPSPTGSLLPAMFLGCFVPRETPAFSPSAGGENRAPASETGDRLLPHPLAAARASAALCCAPGEGAAPPRPDRTSAPTAALTRAGRCLRSRGKETAAAPRGASPLCPGCAPRRSAAPRPLAAPLAFSSTHPRRTSRAPWVSTCSRRASARSPASPSAGSGGGRQARPLPGAPAALSRGCPAPAAKALFGRADWLRSTRRQPLIFPVPLHAGERSASMRPRPSPPAAAGETTSPVWPRAPRRGGAGRSAAPGAAPAGAGGAAAEWPRPAGLRGRRRGEVSARRERGGLTFPLPSAPRSRLGRWDGAGAAIPAAGSGGHVWGSRERQGPARWGSLVARRSGVARTAPCPPPAGYRGVSRSDAGPSTFGSLTVGTGRVSSSKSRWRGSWCRQSARAVGRGAYGPGGILASHINPFVNTHTHTDNAKQAVHSEEQKWTVGNYCRDKPGTVSCKNSRVCVLVEKSLCLHPSGRSLARAHTGPFKRNLSVVKQKQQPGLYLLVLWKGTDRKKGENRW